MDDLVTEHVPVMKMDVQGYEVGSTCQQQRLVCRVYHSPNRYAVVRPQVFALWGSQKLLNARRIRCIKFELAVEWLHRLNTSAEAMYDLLTMHGFGIFAIDLVTPVTRAAFVSRHPYRGASKYPDFVARLQRYQ